MVTTPASESKFSYKEEIGWKFEMQYTKPPVWNLLRLREWYTVYEKWKYSEGEDVVVQAYANCDEAELFLYGVSLGNKQLKDFSDDNIIKWLVPFHAGELKIIASTNGVVQDEYQLNTSGKLSRIDILADKNALKSGTYDVAHVEVNLFDSNGFRISDLDTTITFELNGSANLLAVYNGWEMNVDSHTRTLLKRIMGKLLR